jgi:hypothetical protein
MEAMDMDNNGLSSNVLADITRLLESTRLKKVEFFYGNQNLWLGADATEHFVTTLPRKQSSLQALPNVAPYDSYFPFDSGAASCASIKNSLKRNQQLNRVNLLLVPPPQQQQRRRAATMMLRISHKAIAKFASIPINAGACAIFKLLQARPSILEKRLKRPLSPPVAAATAATAATIAR